jgi:DNA mismatch repair protein MutS
MENTDIKKMNGIFDHYFSLWENYRSKYGTETIVLYEMGSFFEIYGYTDEQISFVNDISDLLGYKVTRRNGNKPLSFKNPAMCGFPSRSLDRIIHSLLEMNYSVVLCEQTKGDDSDKKMERKVTRIYSPGTTIEPELVQDPTHVSSIVLFYEKVHKSRYSVLCAGMATINVSSGEIFMSQNISTEDAPLDAVEEVRRFTSLYRSKEILWYTYDPENVIHRMGETINPPMTSIVHKIPEEKIKTYQRLSYQNKIFGDVFGQNEIDPVERLNLSDKSYSRIALTSLLYFIKDHDPLIIRKLDEPITEKSEVCILSNNAIEQLAIDGKTKGTLLHHIKSYCITSAGRRLIERRLKSPLTNAEDINKRLDHVQIYYDRDEDREYVRKEFRNIKDITRIMRCAVTKRIRLMDIINLWKTAHHAKNIFDRMTVVPEEMNNNCIIFKGPYSFESYKKQSFFCTKLINALERFIDKDYISDERGFPIVRNKCKKLEMLYDRLKFTEDLYQTIAKLCMDKVNYRVEVKCTDNDGIHLITTKARRDMLLKDPPNLPSYVELFKGKKIGQLIVKINTTDIINVYEQFEYIIMKCEYEDRLKEVIKRYGVLLESRYGKQWVKLGKRLAEEDCSAAIAQISKKRNYTRPTIVLSEESFVKASKARHPVLEIQLAKKGSLEAYISNDVNIGEPPITLVFGCNSVGKSSYCRMVALLVIMAQTGIFVPAENMEISPFKRIFTRLLGTDDPDRSLSSFGVELVELRGILSHGGKHCLVVGDELARGTEQDSGNALVTAILERFLDRGDRVVLASHMHGIIDNLKDRKGIRYSHMAVEFDQQNERLIYDRRLMDGVGPTIYGLETAKGYGLPHDIISRAFEIRNTTTHQGLTRSQYNPNFVVSDICDICKKQPVDDIHHIVEQYKADKTGSIGNGLHKNFACNLISVCKNCHNDIHRGNIKVNGYKRTTKGIDLFIKKM